MNLGALGSIVLALVTTRDVERTKVVPPPPIVVVAECHTADDSRNGESVRRDGVVGCRGAVGRATDRTATRFGFRIVHRDGCPWARSEFESTLLGGSRNSGGGPTAEVRLLCSGRPIGNSRLDLRTLVDPSCFDGEIRSFEHDRDPSLSAELVIGSRTIAVAPWSRERPSVDFVLEPGEFRGFAKTVTFRLADDFGRPLVENCDVRLITDRGAERRNASDWPIRPAEHGPAPFPTPEWIAAGPIQVEVTPESFPFLPCSAQLDLPASDQVEIELRVVTPQSLRVIPHPEDRARCANLEWIRLVDPRGFRHRLDAVDGLRPSFDFDAPHADVRLAELRHEFFGAPIGPAHFVIDSQAFPLVIAEGTNVFHLPRLEACERVTLEIGPFTNREVPNRTRIELFTAAGVWIGEKNVEIGRKADRLSDAARIPLPLRMARGEYTATIHVDRDPPVRRAFRVLGPKDPPIVLEP